MTTPRTTLGRRKRRPRGAMATGFLLTPGGLLLGSCAALPLAAIVVSGFTSDAGSFTFANFATIFGNSVYMSLLGRTLLIAFFVTVISICLAWPASWALARYTRPRLKPLILGLVIIPYITSQLLLIYGFVSLIQAGGPVMSALSAIGLASPQTSIMYTPTANIMMLIVESIPTAILVMYSASEQINGSVLEASRTLGASKRFVFTRVIWPLSSAMIGVNFALTFVQTVGAFAEPTILGGPNGQMLGNALATQLQSGVNQQFAVAMALVLLVASLVVVGAVTLLLGWSRSAPSGIRRSTRPRAALIAAQAQRAQEPLGTQGGLR